MTDVAFVKISLRDAAAVQSWCILRPHLCGLYGCRTWYEHAPTCVLSSCYLRLNLLRARSATKSVGHRNFIQYVLTALLLASPQLCGLSNTVTVRHALFSCTTVGTSLSHFFVGLIYGRNALVKLPARRGIFSILNPNTSEMRMQLLSLSEAVSDGSAR